MNETGCMISLQVASEVVETRKSPPRLATDLRVRTCSQGFSSLSRGCRLVGELGEGCWSTISKSFPGRIGKQCRERWHNQLRPDIRRDAWTDQEEELMAAAHMQLGNKWADISKVAESII